MSQTAANLPRKADNSVNWRALVKPEHLYIKKEHESTLVKKLGKPFTDIKVTEVEDKYLVIRKAGILELAETRGYCSKIPNVEFATHDYVIVRTLVAWNQFEDKPAMTTGGIGEAHPGNTSEMGRKYLAANAENRAFARAVRDFLGIDIVSSDELGSPTASDVEPDVLPPSLNPLYPQGQLAKAAGECKTTFEQIKKGAISKQAKQPDSFKGDPNEWTKFEDIAPPDCNTLIALLKKAAAERESQGKGS